MTPDIARIVEAKDPALRNLLITYRYHVLSDGLRAVIAKDHANWSTFATWASKTAGQSIRAEEVPRIVRELVDEGAEVLARLERLNRALPFVPDLVPEHLLDPVRRTIDELSAAISAGNLKVFAELAPLFTDFIATFRDDATYDAAKLDRFLSQLEKGPVEDGGQDLLRDAFRAYLRARFSTDPVEKARLVLLANCKIGLHEQTRLQPQIAEAMNAPVKQIIAASLTSVVRALVPDRFETEVLHRLREPLDELVEEIAVVWRRIATRFLMNLALPFGRELPLGQDLPVFPVPAALEQLDNPEDLFLLWSAYDFPSGHTGARDWAQIRDRMNYIVNLFRARQCEADLFLPPFTEKQIRAIEEGAVPSGRL